MVPVPLDMPIMNGRGIAWHANQPVPPFMCKHQQRERIMQIFFFKGRSRGRKRVGRGWGKKAESMMSLSVPNVPGFIFNIEMR